MPNSDKHKLFNNLQNTPLASSATQAAVQDVPPPGTALAVPRERAGRCVVFSASKVGLVLSLETARVVDCFGDRWPLTAPQNWTLFRVQGLDGDSLVLWPRTATPLEGPVLEDVMLGVDGDANLLVAVEQ